MPKMAIYPTTGYNEHFQYLNVQQTTMPNGMVGLKFISPPTNLVQFNSLSFDIMRALTIEG
jgi:hypothetical protein